MDMTQENAAKLLAGADSASAAVERRAPKEYLAFIGWGLFNAVVIPGFDIFNRRIWGFITIAVAVAGLVATIAYFVRRGMQVEMKQQTPWWAWLFLGLWIALTSFGASALDDRLSFSYVLFGLVAAVPLLAWGLRLRARA